METQDLIMFILMAIGEVCGIFYAIVEWRNPKVDAACIFYAIATGWLIPIIIVGCSPVILMIVCGLFIEWIRPVKYKEYD